MEIEVRNYTKIRVLLYLKELATQAAEGYPFNEAHAWQTPADIAANTGVNVNSLYIILKRWRTHTWGYADGQHFTAEQMADFRPHWLYKINAKGNAYLARLHKWYEPLTDVLAAAAAYTEQHGEDCKQAIAPHCICWHIKPSEWVIRITWPFESSSDASRVMTFGGYRVKDINKAVSMARVVFRLMPSRECLARATELQNHSVKEGLDKLAARAGFTTV